MQTRTRTGRMGTLLLAVTSAWALAGCDPKDVQTDGGAPRDATATPDSGARPDAAAILDAGSTPDGSSAADAEVVADAALPDAGPACPVITLTNWKLVDSDGVASVWEAPVSPNIFKSAADGAFLKIRSKAVGTFDLASAVNGTFQTCEQCLLVGADLVDGVGDPLFFPQSGTLQVDRVSLMNGALKATLKDVRLVQVVIDDSSTKVVEGGACFQLAGSTTIDVAGHCGNGKVDGDESCDGAAFGEKSCASLGYSGGTLGCTDECMLDTRGCDFTCAAIDLGTWDGTRIERLDQDSCTGTTRYGPASSDPLGCATNGAEGSELVYSITVPAQASIHVAVVPAASYNPSLYVTTYCSDLFANACVAGSQKSFAGDAETATVTNSGAAPATYFIVADSLLYGTCGTFSLAVTAPPVCGNAAIEPPDEQCDGALLGGKTCASLGFAGGGSLACTSDCQLDTSGCQQILHRDLVQRPALHALPGVQQRALPGRRRARARPGGRGQGRARGHLRVVRHRDHRPRPVPRGLRAVPLRPRGRRRGAGLRAAVRGEERDHGPRRQPGADDRHRRELLALGRDAGGDRSGLLPDRGRRQVPARRERGALRRRARVRQHRDPGRRAVRRQRRPRLPGLRLHGRHGGLHRPVPRRRRRLHRTDLDLRSVDAGQRFVRLPVRRLGPRLRRRPVLGHVQLCELPEGEWGRALPLRPLPAPPGRHPLRQDELPLETAGSPF
ncbi:MAG: hypothetical protein QM765_34355 [Myxococcales bacterium]